jgi:hypothetical protein
LRTVFLRFILAGAFLRATGLRGLRILRVFGDLRAGFLRLAVRDLAAFRVFVGLLGFLRFAFAAGRAFFLRAGRALFRLAGFFAFRFAGRRAFLLAGFFAFRFAGRRAFLLAGRRTLLLAGRRAFRFAGRRVFFFAGRRVVRFAARFAGRRAFRFAVLWALRRGARLFALFFLFFVFFVVAMRLPYFRFSLDMINRIASEPLGQHDDSDVAAVKWVSRVRQQERRERLACVDIAGARDGLDSRGLVDVKAEDIQSIQERLVRAVHRPGVQADADTEGPGQFEPGPIGPADHVPHRDGALGGLEGIRKGKAYCVSPRVLVHGR